MDIKKPSLIWIVIKMLLFLDNASYFCISKYKVYETRGKSALKGRNGGGESTNRQGKLKELEREVWRIFPATN